MENYTEYYKNLDLNDIVYFCEFDQVFKTEQWKDVVDYEGLYQVSDLGRIKSFYKKQPSVLKLKINRDGYLTFSICKNRTKKSITVHRLVALTFIPNPENKPQVNHKKGIKSYNRVNNLEWVNQSENQTHAIENNLQPINEKHPNSKLKIPDVLFIKNNRNLKSISEMALILKVGKATVRDVLRGATWKNV